MLRKTEASCSRLNLLLKLAHGRYHSGDKFFACVVRPNHGTSGVPQEAPMTTHPFSVQPNRRGRSVRREATAGPHGASSGGPQFVALNSCGRRPPACFRPVAFPRPAAKEIACPESEWLWRRFPAAGRVGAPLAGCRQGAPGGLAGCDRRLCRRGRLKYAFVLEIC